MRITKRPVATTGGRLAWTSCASSLRRSGSRSRYRLWRCSRSCPLLSVRRPLVLLCFGRNRGHSDHRSRRGGGGRGRRLPVAAAPAVASGAPTDPVSCSHSGALLFCFAARTPLAITLCGDRCTMVFAGPMCHLKASFLWLRLPSGGTHQAAASSTWRRLRPRSCRSSGSSHVQPCLDPSSPRRGRCGGSHA